MPRAFGQGRETKLTPERHQKIVEILRAGNYRSVAAGYVGVSEQTLNAWMEKGKRGIDLYQRFREDVLKAEHEAEIRNVGHINNAAQKEWRAAKDWLETKHPERWASTKRVELSGEITLKEIGAAFNAALLGDDDVQGAWHKAGDWDDDALFNSDEDG